jgi:hypothetical protein
VHGLLGEEKQDGGADVSTPGAAATAVTASVATGTESPRTEAGAEAAATEVGTVEVATTEVVVVATVSAARRTALASASIAGVSGVLGVLERECGSHEGPPRGRVDVFGGPTASLLPVVGRALLRGASGGRSVVDSSLTIYR